MVHVIASLILLDGQFTIHISLLLRMAMAKGIAKDIGASIGVLFIDQRQISELRKKSVNQKVGKDWKTEARTEDSILT